MSRRVLPEISLRFVSHCPRDRVPSPSPSSASSSIRFSCWRDETHLGYFDLDVPRTRRLSFHGRCLRVSAIRFAAGALYLPAPVVTSRIMSTAKHVRRVPLDGREGRAEVKKTRRNKGDRRGGDEGFYMSCRLPPPLGTVLTSCLP